MSLYFRHITPSGLVSNTLARKPSFPFSVARLLIYHPESLLDVIIGAWKGSYISQPRTHDPHTNKPHLERPGLSWRCNVARKPSTDLCYIYTDSPAERATERRESLCRVFTSHGWLAATRRLTESLSCPDRQAHEPRWGDWHAGWLVGPNKERKKKITIICFDTTETIYSQLIIHFMSPVVHENSILSFKNWDEVKKKPLSQLYLFSVTKEKIKLHSSLKHF